MLPVLVSIAPCALFGDSGVFERRLAHPPCGSLFAHGGHGKATHAAESSGVGGRPRTGCPHIPSAIKAPPGSIHSGSGCEIEASTDFSEEND